MHSPNKPKKFKQTLSNKKSMATVFLDCKGILLTEFMAPGTTIKSEVYCEMLNKLWGLIQNKWHRMLTKGVVLLHDNVGHHTVARKNALIKLFNWEIFDHPPYSLDLAPSDYHLFTKIRSGWLPSASTPTNCSWIESTTGCVTWQHRSLVRDHKN
jgi:histone-lysine N-methyltransferase SETMAR